MKWICEDCETVFEAPPGRHGFFDFETPYCPSCGGENVDSVEKCDLCGREVPNFQLNNYGGRRICRACEAIVRIERDTAIKHIWESGNKELSFAEIRAILADACE